MESLLFTFSFIISWILLKITIPYYPNFFLDIPNSRSSHIVSTPKSGGISFVLISSIFAFFYSSSNIIYICLPLAIVGLIDDIFNLPSIYRYIAQLITAFALYFSIFKFSHLLGDKFSLTLMLVFIFFLVLITSVINFANFSDGLDGLLSSSMFICFLTASLSSRSEFIPLTGSLLAFVFWNWSKAKIFMGDVGSTFLGSVFIAVVISMPTVNESIGFLLVATPILVDPFTCVLRRYFAKQPIFRPHKLHLYQRLHQAGYRHSDVALLYTTGTALLSIAFFRLDLIYLILIAILEIGLGFWLDQNVAIPFNEASSN